MESTESQCSEECIGKENLHEKKQTAMHDAERFSKADSPHNTMCGLRAFI